MTGRTCMYGYCTREHDEKGAHVKGPPATRHLDTDDATVGERVLMDVSVPVPGTAEAEDYGDPATPPAADANRAPVSGGLDEGEREAFERLLYEHRADALTCYDHPEAYCCVCGAHEVGGYRIHLAGILAARDAAWAERLAAAEGERDRARQDHHYAAMEASAAGDAAEHIEAALAVAKAERDTARREAGERIAVAIEADPDIGRHKAAQRLILRGDDVGTVLSDLRRSVAEAHARIARADALTSDDGSGA